MLYFGVVFDRESQISGVVFALAYQKRADEFIDE